jgi:hypothetical protein
VYKVHDNNDVFCVKQTFNFDYNTTKAIHPVYAVILNNCPMTLRMKEKYSRRSSEDRSHTRYTLRQLELSLHFLHIAEGVFDFFDL